MILHYCDMCGVEVTKDSGFLQGGHRLKTDLFRNGIKLSCEVKVAKDGVWNDGDFCETCIRAALAGEG